MGIYMLCEFVKLSIWPAAGLYMDSKGKQSVFQERMA